MNGELPQVPALVKRFGAQEAAVRVQLAAFYRICELFGWTDLIYNHITARIPGASGQFLINAFGLEYREVTASNLVKIDIDGNVLDGSDATINAPGFTIHSAIHGGREDAHFIVHTHTTEGVSVACSRSGISPHNFYGAQLHEQVASHDFEGISVDLSERKRLVEHLGDKNFLVLRHHGLLTCGATAGAAFTRMYLLQRACEVQLRNAAHGAQLLELSPQILERTTRQHQSAVGKGWDARRDYGQDVYAALIRRLDSLGSDYAT